MPDTNAHIKDFHCKRCRSVEARTDGRDLYFDGIRTPFNPVRVAWDCSGCGQIVEWRRVTPGKNGLHRTPDVV